MAILIVIAAVLLVLILQFLISRLGLKGITAEVDADHIGIEPDEVLTVTLTIRNGSWIIRPFIGFELFFPEGMQLLSSNGVSSVENQQAKVSGSVFLLPRSQVQRSFQLSASARGNYRFGRVILRTGDFLGIRDEKYELDILKSVSVYPRRLSGADISKVTGGIMGDLPIRRFIFEDPVLFSGFREYTGREPMKDISWLQSARTGNLMVRQYDHTTEMSAAVVLDTYGASAGTAEKEFSITRDVCMQLDERGIEYSLFMNAALGGASVAGNYMTAGMGSQHLNAIYMQLANALYLCRLSDEQLIRGAMKNMNRSVGLIIITSADTDEKQRMVQLLPPQLQENTCVIYAE